MNSYRELMRRKLLEEIYDKMSPEEKRTFIQLTLEQKSREEILQALNQQGTKIDNISHKIGKYPFASDLLANVAGNAITDGAVWLFSRLIKKL